MLSKIHSAALYGIEAIPIRIETDLSKGIPAFHVVGLADAGVREARERIRAAIRASGFTFPMGRLTVNMSPAGFRKRGTLLDLPMAVGILASSGQLMTEDLERMAFVGELSLDGEVNRVDGVLPVLMALRKKGIRRIAVPRGNRSEASLLKDLEVYEASTLQAVARHINREKRMPRILPAEVKEAGPKSENWGDFADVRGCENAKRIITLAAAGGHGILMRGSPSTGKTMLAERIPGIMPPMTYEEILEVTRIYSAAGLLKEDQPYIIRRPFRRPYHGITKPALLGGGTWARPGEITLADKGVLFLDEFCEYDRGTIDALRQPLETKQIQVNRLADSFIYPADCLLVAAANPCKCGYFGDPDHGCSCSPADIRKYQARISGPVLDRIDIHLWLTPIGYNELTEGKTITTAEMRAQVLRAREIQTARFRGEPISLNSQMSAEQCHRFLMVDSQGEEYMKEAYVGYGLNPRTLLRISRVARTIADLEEEERVTRIHLMEATQYREKVVKDE